MENAGRGAAEIIHRHYGPSGACVVYCGTGNNGGDGCVIARHLHNLGWDVSIVTTGGESRMSADMATNFRIVCAMGIDNRTLGDSRDYEGAAFELPPECIVVDALLGTGFHGSVRDPLDRLIDAINGATKRAVIAVDVPSGLDCDTGMPSNAVVRADRTVTFVAPKSGFEGAEVRSYLGIVDTVQIGAPRALIEEIAGRP